MAKNVDVLKLILGNGINTSVEEFELEPGELVQATGGWYPPGNRMGIKRIGGREDFGPVQNLFTDGSLEDWSGPSTLSEWSSTQGGSTLYQESGVNNVFKGTYSARWERTTNTTSNALLGQRFTNIAPNTTYKVSFVAKSNLVDPDGMRVRIVNETEDPSQYILDDGVSWDSSYNSNTHQPTVGPTATDWRRYQFEFTTSGSFNLGDTYLIAFSHNKVASGTITYLDSMELIGPLQDDDFRVKGLEFLNFDDSSKDKLLAYVGSGYFQVTPGPTGDFTLASGVSISGEFMHGVHYDDRWYIVNGQDANLVFQDDGTIRTHGMSPPFDFAINSNNIQVSGTQEVKPTSNAVTAGSHGDQWVNPAGAYDSDEFTFMQPNLQGMQTIGTETIRISGMSGFTSDGTGYVEALYSLDTGFRENPQQPVDPTNGNATWSITASWPGGSSTMAQGNFDTEIQDITAQATIPSGVHISGVSIDCSVNVIVPYFNRTDFWRVHELTGFAVSGEKQGPGLNTTSGIFYGITEWDAVNRVESAQWQQNNSINLLSFSGVNPQTGVSGIQYQDEVRIDLPASGAVNSNATHYRIYRTTDGGIQPIDLGLIGEVAVGNDFFIDKFTKSFNTPAVPKLPILQVTDRARDITSYYAINKQPSAWSHINVFQGSLVGVDALSPRQLNYTPPAFPEGSPTPYVIDNFSLKDNDTLVGTASLDSQLIVFANQAVLTMNLLPLVESTETIRENAVNVLEGAPGCVGPNAFTTLENDVGTTQAAWASRFGVHVTDGARVKSITDDLDWENTVSDTDTNKWSLFWDKQHRVLWFNYKNVDDEPRYLLLHNHQLKPNGMPKITGPHYGQISKIIDGVDSNNFHRIWSAHLTDGHIYLEWASGLVLDASASYNASGVIPFEVKTGRYYSDDYSDFMISKANVRHGDFGTATSGQLTIDYGRDQNTPVTGSTTKWVDLNGRRGSEVFIGRSMEWAQATINYEGSGLATLNDIRLIIPKHGDGDSGSR